MEFAAEGPMAIPLWINGHALLTVGESFYDVISPHTGEALRRVPLCGAGEAAEAVAAARAAQPGWADMGLPARRVCLVALAEALERYAGHFAKLLSQEIAIDEAAANGEVVAAVAALRAAEVGETGVVAIVVDALRPLSGVAAAMAPALLAGATVVVKPSPRAPAAVFALCELSARSAWPAGVLNLLQGDTAAIDGLCAAGVERLMFRGNAALGAQIGAIAEAAGTPYVLQAV
jgi:acyl-CoA reductase-like NAD-dependent aldehyde dehydrogenase